MRQRVSKVGIMRFSGFFAGSRIRDRGNRAARLACISRLSLKPGTAFPAPALAHLISIHVLLMVSPRVVRCFSSTVSSLLIKRTQSTTFRDNA
ncbi:hypothetical protein BDV10DRAFT_175217 [Aspergillus recurvatus]